LTGFKDPAMKERESHTFQPVTAPTGFKARATKELDGAHVHLTTIDLGGLHLSKFIEHCGTSKTVSGYEKSFPLTQLDESIPDDRRAPSTG
jgi:hypothetical protein